MARHKKKTRLRLPPEERREQLKQAGLSAFVAAGYVATTIDDIVGRAGVAKGTFYLHFSSKQALFLALLDDFRDGVLASFASLEVEHLAGGESFDVQAILVAAYRCFFDFCLENLELARLFLQETVYDEQARARRQEIYEAFAALAHQALEAGSEAGLLASDIQPRIAAHAIVGMIERVATQWLLVEGVTDPAPLIEELARFETYGIHARDQE